MRILPHIEDVNCAMLELKLFILNLLLRHILPLDFCNLLYNVLFDHLMTTCFDDPIFPCL
jgi:hypothetical protein